MKDFIKIFIAIFLMVSAFLVGRNYGEKTYLESEDYKKIVSEREELDFAKNEFENAKAKLQNIIDRGEKEKTDELLSQIFTIFLNDLGLRIQNQDLILKQAKANSSINESSPPATAIAEKINSQELSQKTTDDQNRKEERLSKKIGKIKSAEWILENTVGGSETLRSLDKVVLKNIKNFLIENDDENTICENFMGDFKGSVKDNNNKNFGSMSYKLLPQNQGGQDLLKGQISWFNEPYAPLSQQINNSCGKKIKNLTGRFFNLSDNSFVQLYQLQNKNKIAGNFYETLPNGTTKRIGKFVLNRTDRF